MHRLALVALTIVVGTMLGGCGQNAKRAKATVSYIDRNCDIVETTYDGNDVEKSRETYRDSCSTLDDWEKIRSQRDRKISGKAVVHVEYIVPQTGEAETAELEFDGRDDEFYALKAGDQIDILVSNSDPKRIEKA